MLPQVILCHVLIPRPVSSDIYPSISMILCGIDNHYTIMCLNFAIMIYVFFLFVRRVPWEILVGETTDFFCMSNKIMSYKQFFFNLGKAKNIFSKIKDLLSYQFFFVCFFFFWLSEENKQSHVRIFIVSFFFFQEPLMTLQPLVKFH